MISSCYVYVSHAAKQDVPYKYLINDTSDCETEGEQSDCETDGDKGSVKHISHAPVPRHEHLVCSSPNRSLNIQVNRCTDDLCNYFNPRTDGGGGYPPPPGGFS